MARRIVPTGSNASIARIGRLTSELCDLLGGYVVGTREDRDVLAGSRDDQLIQVFELAALLNVLFEQTPERREQSLDDAQWLDDDDE